MATEYAAPFVGSTIATAQQFRDRNRCTAPDGIDADVNTSVGVVTDGGAGTSINIANISALVQGARYELTAGPLNLPVAANGGGSNRYDIVCLTYDATHSPGVYARIVQGTPGAGLPALTHSLTGVFDFPFAHYQKTPAGAITGIIMRRRYLDPSGQGIVTPDPQPVEWVFPTAAARRASRVRYWPSGEEWVFDGTNWIHEESMTGWTSYTPAWTSSGTAPGLGNGSTAGRYSLLPNKTIAVYARVTMGTTSTYGTGTYRLSTPPGFDARTTEEQSLNCKTYDLSANLAYGSQAVLSTGYGNLQGASGVNGAFQGYTATIPFTYANGDRIWMQGVYEYV